MMHNKREVLLVQGRIFFRKPYFWLVCGIPSFLSGVYLTVVAVPRYESETVIKVYSASEQPSEGGASGMVSQASPGSYVFKSFVEGYDCLTSLDRNWMMSDWTKGDFLTKFGGVNSFFGTNNIRLWDYYRSRVTVNVDDVSGLVKLNVEGFSPNFSYGMTKTIMQRASDELRQSGIKAYRAEIAMTQERIKTDRARLAEHLFAMQTFQSVTGLGDYKAEYESVLGMIDKFEEARLSVVSRKAAVDFLAAHSQEADSMRVQLDTIDRRIADARGSISKKLSPQYKAYSMLENSIKEDIQVLLMDQKNLLQAEGMAVRNAYYIDYIEAPVKPPAPTEPRAVKWFLIILAGTFLLYAITKKPDVVA